MEEKEEIIFSDNFKWSVRKKSYMDGIIQDMIGPARREETNFAYIERWCSTLKKFIDIGAHVGNYSIRVSFKFKEIIAVEPNPFNFTGLVRNIQLNNLNNIKVINLALSDRHEELYLIQKGGGSRVSREKKEGSIAISAVTLDSFNFSDVSVVKIDTEGWEIPILEGSKNLISTCKPLLLIDLHEKTYNIQGEEERVLSFLFSFSYKLVDHYLSVFGDKHLILVPQ